jgi:hypothetical protein
MGEDMEQGDVVLPAPTEIRDELAKRRLELERALANERQQQCGGRQLRQRGQVEDRCCRAGRVRSGRVIRAERSGRVRLGRSLPFDAYDARGEERACGRVDDGLDPLEAQRFFIPSPIR